jgi:2-polyprenyl-6-methoxyphenol hydroxylase-like FAD-dependent oxidoreductase
MNIRKLNFATTKNNGKKYYAEHAVIIGGGFGGLLTGRVLASYFKKVTIIEKDSATEVNKFSPRKGVPQGAHAHNLNLKGMTILQDLFPHIDKVLEKNGACKMDAANGLRICDLGLKPPFQYGKYIYSQSRPLLEAAIRSFFTDYPNVVFLYGSEAEGLLVNFKENRMTGVRVVDKKTNEKLNLYADFVVDASGRFTQCPDWLESLGYPRPVKEEVKIDLRYISRLYRCPKDYTSEWKVFLIKGVSPHKKFGILNTIENDTEGTRWEVTLAGQYGDYPPTTDEGFLEFASKLVRPDIYETIKQLTPLTPCIPFNFPSTWRYHYERMTRLPSRFIVIGDAISALSPSNGLGMTACALMVEALNKVLSQYPGLNGIERHYFKNALKWIDVTWNINVNIEGEGKHLFGINIMNWYQSLVLELCGDYPEIWKKVFAVSCFEKSPLTLFHPSILCRVLFRSRRHTSRFK